ncbi:4-hydroxyphenylacetate 3-monooxygenase, oxygenase component [Bacillus sp. FJAT-47783]|uniref:4-hydroxyphenylacetate 3-monooxygenase, oxygenase component n=1 Tax=Bacillus sp. FJAT-47783 TaxID=2922712 RepID=UPI001FADC8F9|nr:4-hydroxyphenylacetate 3-monooxygenase, oxygenase component [Bacillus sp. FJAT-47783]
MPAISGNEYIQRIDELQSQIWVEGERIVGRVSEHQAYKGAMKTKASLYDFQVNANHIYKMTFTSPLTGNRVGMSFLEPKSKKDLEKRRTMIQLWATQTAGMMGRTPDYMNTALMAFTAASSILKEHDSFFMRNLIQFFETAREHDLSFTHSFINPQVNRSSTYRENKREPIAAKVIEETSDGLIIKGARLVATEGGMTDEVIVLPSKNIPTGEDEYAFSFSIPSNTKGLKFIGRPSFCGGESTFDHPLSSQFEEMDTMVVFDNVLVPWERVFIYNRSGIAQKFFVLSSFIPHALHQVICRQIVKTEFMLGTAQLLTNTLDVSEYKHIQEKISDMIMGLETLKSLLYRAEQEAAIDQWGTMTPNRDPLYVAVQLFAKLYPKWTETLQKIGASGMIMLPCEEDFKCSDIKQDLYHYLQTDTLNAKERTKLFRFAWDLTMSSFGSRQTLYEQYFFGDPERLYSNLYYGYNRVHCVERVRNFLDIQDL